MAAANAGASEASAASRKDRVVTLCILPCVQMLMSLYIYSCVPLHLMEIGLDLLHLGIFSSLALGTRVVLPMLAARFVALEKLVIPSFALALGSGLLNCFFPTSHVAIDLNIYCVMLMPARCVFQAAAVQVWRSERVKALRLYEAFYTIGYCLSSLWGATVYTLGGWTLCIWCQVGVLAAALVLACTVSVLRPACGREARSRNPSTDEVGSEPQVAGVATETDDRSGQAPNGKGSGGAVSPHEQPDNQRGWWRLALFICIGSGVYIFAYACEWSIYLVHLTSRFDMNVLSIGVGQMIGDIGGAVILMLSMLTGKSLTCTTLHKKAAACGGCLFGLPWSMVWMGAVYALAYILFMLPEVALAVAGQVMMGTMYVLLQQGSSELVEWCSRAGRELHDEGGEAEAGSQQRGTYQSYAALADACFSCGAGLGSILPFVVLDALGTEWVCYIAALLVGAYTVAFACVFRYFPRGGTPQAPKEEPTTWSV